MINNKYNLIEKIGEGNFGSIYKGQNIRTNELVAIKVEPTQSCTNLLKNEAKIYQYLLNSQNVPKVKWFGKDDKNYYMVINLLGRSLEKLKTEKFTFSLETISKIGINILIILKEIHSKEIIHRDIKPDNFLLDHDNKLYLIDFGLAKIHNTETNEVKKSSSLIGSLSYASINAHNFIELSKRDDLLSLGYMLMYFYFGNLPWREIDPTFNINDKVKKLKIEILNNEKLPEILKTYMEYVNKLEINETPNYELLISKFKKML